MTAHSADTAHFEWQGHDEAENFIIEVQNTRYNNGYFSITTYDTLPCQQTSYTLHNIDTSTYYRLRIQKSTRYTPASYDSVVYSPWSDGITLGHYPTPPPQDTTVIQLAQNETFALSPNPASHSTTLHLAMPAPTECYLSIIDLLGHELQRIPLPAGTTEHSLDLSALPAATYMLTLTTPSGSTTQRLVVN